MNVAGIFGAICAWHILGIVIIVMSAVCDCAGVVIQANGVEFVDPCFIYKYKHNWFVAIICAVYYSVLLPIPTMCYWLYKFGGKLNV
jgi:hypothetical protein